MMMGDQVMSLHHVCQIAEQHNSTNFAQRYHQQWLLNSLTSHMSLAHQLHSSNDKTGILMTKTIVTNIHSLSSPICRIDLLRKATRVWSTRLQGRTIIKAGRATTVINNSKKTAFCAVNLATEHRNVHRMAGYNLYFHNCLNNRIPNQKTACWVGGYTEA